MSDPDLESNEYFPMPPKRRYPMTLVHDDELATLSAARAQIATMQTCARDRLDDIAGVCDTYEDAFRKLEIACGALRFISGTGVQMVALSDAGDVGRVVEAAREYKRLHEAYEAAIPKAKYPEKLDTYELTEALRALFAAVAALEGETT